MNLIESCCFKITNDTESQISSCECFFLLLAWNWPQVYIGRKYSRTSFCIRLDMSVYFRLPGNVYNDQCECVLVLPDTLTYHTPLATPANDNPHPMCLYLCPLKLDLPMKGAYSDTKFPKTGTTSSLQKHA